MPAQKHMVSNTYLQLSVLWHAIYLIHKHKLICRPNE